MQSLTPAIPLILVFPYSFFIFLFASHDRRGIRGHMSFAIFHLPLEPDGLSTLVKYNAFEIRENIVELESNEYEWWNER